MAGTGENAGEKTGEKTGGLTYPWLVLGVGAIGVGINVADWFVGDGRPQPYDVFPLLLVLWAAGDLLKERRPTAARAMRGTAGVVLFAAGLAVGVPAAAAAARGETFAWLDLIVGVLVILYAVAMASALAMRKGSGT
ncbi:hypothetical protein AB0A69_00725 [Streptomyces sp. NPDC045431]|uniref:hypothetical protein n=1 Tax=Streptomyces sp. NPDC045431 TaxID=3155613 RepID=UPI0033D6FAF1